MSVLSFHGIGLIDSLIDSARLLRLYLSLLVIGCFGQVWSRPAIHGQPALPKTGYRNPSGAAEGAALAVFAALLMPPALAGTPSDTPAADDRTATMAVGRTRSIRTVAEASRMARDGTIVEIDAGTYRGDVAVWTQDRLTIRAVGGRVRLIADGAAAEDKAIWVVRGGQVEISGIDFEQARAPARNGAGIRFERGRLVVRDCRFVDNEMGLLTGNDPQAELTVEGSEFGHNHRPDGHNHNLYVGTIRRLTAIGNYMHHATIGHLLKSRAAENHVYYNRLTDESNGRASYEMEFPNGGLVIAMGNIIQQAPGTDNPVIVSYGAEGYRWPDNVLVLVHNTLVDERPAGGVAIRVMPGPVQVMALNNLFVGATVAFEGTATVDFRGNRQVEPEALVDAARHDYRLRAAARAGRNSVELEPFRGLALRPDRQYEHPRSTRALGPGVLLPGALQ